LGGGRWGEGVVARGRGGGGGGGVARSPTRLFLPRLI